MDARNRNVPHAYRKRIGIEKQAGDSGPLDGVWVLLPISSLGGSGAGPLSAMGIWTSRQAGFMSSMNHQIPLPLQISIACLIGGIVCLLSTRLMEPDWSSSSRNFWAVSISSHSALVGITFWIYRKEKLSLVTWAGLFNSFTLALIASLTTLCLVVLSWIIPIVLIGTGRAFLTAFVATFLYALFRTLDS
jgi:hypothetical protein